MLVLNHVPLVMKVLIKTNKSLLNVYYVLPANTLPVRAILYVVNVRPVRPRQITVRVVVENVLPANLRIPHLPIV